jgi:hypothetical protein
MEPSAIDVLTAKTTPSAVVRRVVREAQQGALISGAHVRAELRKVRAPKNSTVEPGPPGVEPVIDAVSRGITSQGFPTFFQDDAEDGPSVEELMRQAAYRPPPEPTRLGLHRTAKEWYLLLTAARGFLDYEEELEDALHGKTLAGLEPRWDAATRGVLKAVLAGLRDELAAQEELPRDT